MPEIPADPEFLDVACDVAIRFRGHDSYGNEAGARPAFRRRVPGHEPAVYEHTLARLVALYDAAVDAVRRHRVSGPIGCSAKPEDIDVARCHDELDRLDPDIGRAEKTVILDWVIYWHYLR